MSHPKFNIIKKRIRANRIRQSPNEISSDLNIELRPSNPLDGNKISMATIRIRNIIAHALVILKKVNLIRE